MVDKSKQSIWVTVATVVVAALAFFAARELTSGGFGAARRAMTPTSEVEMMLDDLTAKDPAMSAIAEHFPSEWRQIRQGMAEDVKSSASNAELRARGHARTRAFVVARAPQTATASTDLLLAVAAGESAFIEQLQKDDLQLCAQYASRGLPPEAQLEPATMGLLSRAAALRIVATRRGTDAPVQRPAPSDADWTALGDAMVSLGATEAMLAGLGDPSASPQVQCGGGVLLYKGLLTLPEEQGARLFAAITVEAAKQ